jgi:hypothetical protein
LLRSGTGADLLEPRRDLTSIIETLRRQRVRQDDFDAVLDSVRKQASAISARWPSGPLADIASQMDRRAREIQGMKRSVPKFVVEDLIDEAIRGLQEQARRDG